MIQEALISATQEGAQQLLRDYNARDFNTFGALRESIHAEGNKILAKGYIFNLIRGQKPGARLADWREDSPLHNWVTKKIANINTRSVAYLIARKIHQQGDRIYRQEREPLDVGTSKALTLSVFNENLKDKIKEKIKKANELR